MTVGAALKIVDQVAPRELAFPNDHVGLQVGDPSAQVTGCMVSLDSSLAAVRHCSSVGANLLVSHHPVIWNPLEALRADDVRQAAVMEMVQSGVSFIAAHTNWDAAPGGINDALCSRLGLTAVKSFGYATPVDKLKIATFVPALSVDAVVDAMSEAGAGVIGAYTRCAFASSGVGTFIGGAGSAPVVGVAGEVTSAEEVRIEMVLDARCRSRVEGALMKAHPYDQPAYDVYALAQKARQPAGRVGRLVSPLGLSKFLSDVNERLGTASMLWAGASSTVSRVAVVGGAAAGEWKAAQKAGADTFVTGEVPQNIALEASESGMTILASGHYATEQPGCEDLCSRLGELGLEAELFVPEAGVAGRPLV